MTKKRCTIYGVSSHGVYFLEMKGINRLVNTTWKELTLEFYKRHWTEGRLLIYLLYVLPVDRLHKDYVGRFLWNMGMIYTQSCGSRDCLSLEVSLWIPEPDWECTRVSKTPFNTKELLYIPTNFR